MAILDDRLEASLYSGWLVEDINAPDTLEYDKTLREGMTICIEPESTMEVKGVDCYVKVEDVWVVEADGLRRISPVVGWDYCGH